MPGVQIQTSGSPGRLSTVRIRGANPTQVQVLIDGVRVKSPTSATSTSPTSPSTTSSGSRSCGARSRRSTAPTRSAAWSTSSRSAGRGALGIRGPRSRQLRDLPGAGRRVRGQEALKLLPRGEQLDFGGQFDNDDHDLTSVNARIGYALPKKGELSLIGRFQDSHSRHPVRHGLPGLRSEPRPEPASSGSVARVAPALDVHLGASPPGVGRR